MRVTFEYSEQVAEDVQSFYFSPEKPVRYTAGQFSELTLPSSHHDARGQKRWFTLSSSPTEDYLAITTKLSTGMPTSTFKQLLQTLKPGDTAMMSDPMGDFVLPKDPSIPLVFICGGIGVTPMRSMVQWLQDNQQQRTIHLIYSGRNLTDMAFRDIFASYGLPVTIILSNPPAQWTGQTGRLTAEKVLELAPDVDKKLYFVSGPEFMVESLVSGLSLNGIAPSRVVGDYFHNYKVL